MSEKICLPHHSVVSRWKKEKVIKWLKKVHLEDCIPAFEARHIDGTKLLELTEQKLFTYQDLKIKHRKQIAKCVQECKSQATNAKRIAKSLKKGHGSQSNSTESNGTYDDSDDFDDWGSDFEDDSFDEDQDEQLSLEINNNTIPSLLTDDKSLSSSSVSSKASENEKGIPKPPDVPLIPKATNGASSYKSSNVSTIPRPPVKRPDSQPPPPPIQQSSGFVETQEDYEIPIGSSSTESNEPFSFSSSAFHQPVSNDNFSVETYEIVEPPEENYEIVDPPMSSLKMADKPMLPPRQLKSPVSGSPPPLPQKPQRLRENSIGSDRTEGIRTFSRPKLPIKPENDPQIETTQLINPTSNVGFISSLIGRRSSSTQSPKFPHKSKDTSEPVGLNIPVRSSNDNLLLNSTSPDKDGFMSSFEAKKMQIASILSKSPISSDDIAQNMATRPLPPVPVINKQQADISLCPWFHEIEREDAEAAVKKLNEAGSFVVRPSKRAGKDNPYSLTVLHEDRLFHLNIRQRPDKAYALGREKEKEKTFSSVADLITHHLKEPILLKNRGEAAGHTILRKYPEKS